MKALSEDNNRLRQGHLYEQAFHNNVTSQILVEGPHVKKALAETADGKPRDMKTPQDLGDRERDFVL